MKNRRRGGFTLAELLIVVAIIAVLVAVAIPVFSGQLESAREAVDAHNLRAAYSAEKIMMMTNPDYAKRYFHQEAGKNAYFGIYDPASGNIYPPESAPASCYNIGKVTKDGFQNKSLMESMPLTSGFNGADVDGIYYTGRMYWPQYHGQYIHVYFFPESGNVNVYYW